MKPESNPSDMKKKGSSQIPTPKTDGKSLGALVISFVIFITVIFISIYVVNFTYGEEAAKVLFEGKIFGFTVSVSHKPALFFITVLLLYQLFSRILKRVSNLNAFLLIALMSGIFMYTREVVKQSPSPLLTFDTSPTIDHVIDIPLPKADTYVESVLAMEHFDYSNEPLESIKLKTGDGIFWTSSSGSSGMSLYKVNSQNLRDIGMSNGDGREFAISLNTDVGLPDFSMESRQKVGDGIMYVTADLDIPDYGRWRQNYDNITMTLADIGVSMHGVLAITEQVKLGSVTDITREDFKEDIQRIKLVMKVHSDGNNNIRMVHDITNRIETSSELLVGVKVNDVLLYHPEQ